MGSGGAEPIPQLIKNGLSIGTETDNNTGSLAYTGAQYAGTPSCAPCCLWDWSFPDQKGPIEGPPVASMVGDLKVERLVGFLRRNHRPFMNRHLNHEPPSPPHSHGPRGPHAPPSAIGPLRRRRPLLLQPPQRLYRPGAAPVRRKATTPQLVLGCRRRLRPVPLRMRRRRWHGLFRRRRCLYDANTRRSRRFVGRVHVWVVAHDVRVRRPSTHNTTCAPDARASWYLYPPCHGGEEEADYGKGEEGCCGCRCFSVAQDTKPGVDCGGMVPFELFYGSISCLPPPAFHRRAKDKAQNQPPIARRLFPTLYGAVISQLQWVPLPNILQSIRFPSGPGGAPAIHICPN